MRRTVPEYARTPALGCEVKKIGLVEFNKDSSQLPLGILFRSGVIRPIREIRVPGFAGRRNRLQDVMIHAALDSSLRSQRPLR